MILSGSQSLLSFLTVIKVSYSDAILIGERERANLVVQLTRFFCIYIYIFLSGEATYRITLYILLNQRGLRTSSISAPQLPENSGFHRKKPDFSAHSGNKPFSPNNAAHFSQCSLLYSWLQRVLQPLWKAWMGLPHQQLVVAVALRLVGGGWNVSVHAGGSALLQKQQRRERRLSQRRARDRARRAARSSPTSETRLVQMGSVERRRRATETPDQRETRLAQSQINITCL